LENLQWDHSKEEEAYLMTQLNSKEVNINYAHIFYKDNLLIYVIKNPVFYPIFNVLNRG